MPTNKINTYIGWYSESVDTNIISMPKTHIPFEIKPYTPLVSEYFGQDDDIPDDQWKLVQDNEELYKWESGSHRRSYHISGKRMWEVDGRFHNETGPAYKDKELHLYYLFGHLLKPEQHKLICSYGKVKGYTYQSDVPTFHVVDAKNNQRWVDLNGDLHRIDGPALITSTGEKWWYRNGRLFNNTGPVLEKANGEKFWYVNNKFVLLDELNKINNKPSAQTIKTEEIQKTFLPKCKEDASSYDFSSWTNPNGTKFWYRKGVIYRVDGPAKSVDQVYQSFIYNYFYNINKYVNGLEINDTQNDISFKFTNTNGEKLITITAGTSIIYSIAATNDAKPILEKAIKEIKNEYCLDCHDSGWALTTSNESLKMWVKDEFNRSLSTNGARYFLKNGKYHRDGGPAVIASNQVKFWYKNGELHREDGPAVVNNGKYRYYLFNYHIPEEKYKEIFKRPIEKIELKNKEIVIQYKNNLDVIKFTVGYENTYPPATDVFASNTFSFGSSRIVTSPVTSDTPKPSITNKNQSLKKEVSDAAIRSSSNQIVNVVKGGLVIYLKDQGIPESQLPLYIKFLDSDLGKVFIQVLLGHGLAQLKQSTTLDKFAKEFRIAGYSGSIDLLIGQLGKYILPSISQTIQKLPTEETSQKVRLSTPEEEIIDEDLEEEYYIGARTVGSCS